MRFVDPANPQAFAEASDSRTRAYYAETLPNPKLEVFPIGGVAEIGRERGIPLIVDNTRDMTRPLIMVPPLSVKSLTKYIGRHGTSIGGIIIDGGNFDWAAYPDQQPALNTPDPSYHGTIWSEAAKPLGPIAYALKARATLLRDLGGALSRQMPFSLFRVWKHCRCAFESMSKMHRQLQIFWLHIRPLPQ